jgi:hypothetical protein
MRSVWHFLQYNNLVPVTLFVIFGGTGVALAATPQVQQAVYSSHEEVKGVDNSYLISADLSHYDFGLHITGITEDDDNYYVAYAYKTITLVDYVWKQADVAKTLTLSKKEVLGHDLGLMVQKQLGEEITHEMAYLVEAQGQERKTGLTVRTADTTYSGLIGARLDPTTKEFPTYVPVVAEARIDSGAPAAAALAALGGSHDALPPAPAQNDIQKLVNDAVANALANAQNQPTSTPSEVADNTPPADQPGGTASNPPASAGSGGTQTPPADTSTSTPDSAPPATTTPATTAPSEDTSTTTTQTPPAATTTPPSDASPADASSTPPAETPPADASASASSSTPQQ